MQLFLGLDGEEDIELDVIGFEYGRCTKVAITGDIQEMDLFFLPNKGIHRITVTDGGEAPHIFGP